MQVNIGMCLGDSVKNEYDTPWEFVLLVSKKNNLNTRIKLDQNNVPSQNTNECTYE